MNHLAELKAALKENTPNLDCITCSILEMGEINVELTEISMGFRNLASYAEAKEMAMVCRAKGNIDHAERFEKAAEQVYAMLPDWAKW